MDNKEKYRIVCETNREIPIFSRPFWLDAVSEDGEWDVVLAERNQEVVATMPYYMKKKALFRYITMPVLTPRLGPWIQYPQDQKYTNKIAFEKEILTELAEKLPPFDYFIQSFNYNIDNWLPFHWRNYEQTTRYTYVIDNLSDLDEVYGNFRSNIRQNIRKAEKLVRVDQDDDIEKFYEINRRTFQRQQLTMPYSLQMLKRLDQACAERQCRKMWFAVDRDGNIHCSLYLVWDEHSAYYLMGGGDPVLRNSGAMSLLMWEAIRYAPGVTRRFDFEGSMLEPVERFIRAFGAVQKPYMCVTKTNSKVYRAMKLAKEVIFK